MTKFESTLLEKVDRLNDSLATLTERLTVFEGDTKQSLSELSGKMRGNHELLKKEIQYYVDKDSCGINRERQGTRIKEVEDRVLVLEGSVKDLFDHEKERSNNYSERITAWLPSIIILISAIGGIIWMMGK